MVRPFDLHPYFELTPPGAVFASDFVKYLGGPNPRALTIGSLIIADSKVAEGTLIESQSWIWEAMADLLIRDPSAAIDLRPELWEELVAGAYHKAGFEEVILTSRSGDQGRDIIAIKKGVGTIKIITSVKAYKPGHLVDYDDVRAIVGVMAMDTSVSKAMLTTTSKFPPRIMKDSLIRSLVPTRLELMDGDELVAWLKQLQKNKERRKAPPANPYG